MKVTLTIRAEHEYEGIHHFTLVAMHYDCDPKDRWAMEDCMKEELSNLRYQGPYPWMPTTLGEGEHCYLKARVSLDSFQDYQGDWDSDFYVVYAKKIGKVHGRRKNRRYHKADAMFRKEWLRRQDSCNQLQSVGLT